MGTLMRAEICWDCNLERSKSSNAGTLMRAEIYWGFNLEITAAGSNGGLDALKIPTFPAPGSLPGTEDGWRPSATVPCSSCFLCRSILLLSSLVKGEIYLGKNSSRNLKIKTSLTEFYRLPCTLIYSLCKIFLSQLLKLFSDNVSNDRSKGFLSFFIFTLFLGFQTGLFEHSIFSLSFAIHS